jgi:hypothetical protein
MFLPFLASVLQKTQGDYEARANAAIKQKEYDAELVVLTSQINESNYDSILAIMIDKFKDYVRECYFYHNSGNRYYMIGILMMLQRIK